MSTILKGALALLIWQGAAPAFADQYDTVNYTASVGAMYDNNIFRLPSWVDPQAAIGNASKSDWMKTASVGVNVDKQYSNQELLFNGTVSDNKFNTFSFLDYNNANYNAAWKWSLGSRLSGALSLQRTQTLTNFSNVHVYTRNLNTVDNRSFAVDWWLQSNWHLFAAVANEQSTSSVSTINNLSYLNRTGEGGVKYDLNDGTSVSLAFRALRGGYSSYVNPDYANLVDSSYTERQQELRFKWPLTGKSALSGNLMQVRRRYPTFYQRNYDGTQGGLNYAWDMTGKILLNLSLDRTLGAWFDAASSYYVDDTVALSPVWQMSSKVSLRMSISRGKADYRGAIVPGAIARHDTTQSGLVGIDWMPRRSVKLSASLQHSRRSTNYLAYEYNDNSASLSLTLSF